MVMVMVVVVAADVVVVVVLVVLVYVWWSNSVYWQFDQADEWRQLPTMVAAFQWRHLIVQCGLIGLVRLLVAFKQQAVVPFTSTTLTSFNSLRVRC